LHIAIAHDELAGNRRKHSMHVNRRELFWIAAGATSTGVVALPAFAQSYPSRPIRLIVPSSPGGVHDIVARLWAEKLKPFATIVVENRSGAGTIIGAAEVGRAEPDGYTLLLGSTNTHVLQPLSANRPAYDPLKDFSPVTLIGTTATAVAINPKLPAQTLREFIDYVKARPGQLAYGHGGTGTSTHLSGELFKQLAGGLDLISVPYKGLSPAFADAISGQIAMVTTNVTSQVTGFHKSQQLRLLAVNSPTRIDAAPDIPTATEAGLPGMVAQTFFAIFAPANMPSAILEALNAPTQAALKDEDFRQTLMRAGFDPLPGYGPAEAKRYIADEYARWEPLVKRLKPEG
jgi:tripartite-type tricarboxylate transporter receptor subunit TctC